ncbi:heme NO-binding domain-containing protein [Meridianimarinicoccus aquatilis]|uniref:Guanylate cyclase n=1 Tax=Meridianimarinicoccus aquatilis TaxID=2552766 RepID=A0A4R6B2T8_9RHOB|nr:heme NO-binding domain-containing protein [Fluviibacterium aquatile]QIE43224.1 guanylate cyclase [Rhodobacteraceae bacterium SC52]TDL90515.1 guanylate cyclase [Fluviibacterium aquatile]
MKGVVFVELLSMAESAFGEDVVDNVLDKADLENGGAYTTVGNYPCEELVKIVQAFSDHSGLSPEVLQRKFGHWMMEFFAQHYGGFFEGKEGSLEMLEAVDGEIHVEVRKLYPDAELPRFDARRVNDTELELLYSSPRPLVEFCHGLIEACVDRFGESGSIDIDPTVKPGNKNSTMFNIKLNEQ